MKLVEIRANLVWSTPEIGHLISTNTIETDDTFMAVYKAISGETNASTIFTVGNEPIQDIHLKPKRTTP